MPRAHGTRNRYKIDECRCGRCIQANANYELQRAAADDWLPKFPPAEEWMADGECRRRGMTPDDFYLGGADVEGREAARAVCAACPESIRTLCREFALDYRIDWGIWGGTTGKDREEIRRERRHGRRRKVTA